MNYYAKPFVPYGINNKRTFIAYALAFRVFIKQKTSMNLIEQIKKRLRYTLEVFGKTLLVLHFSVQPL